MLEGLRERGGLQAKKKNGAVELWLESNLFVATAQEDPSDRANDPLAFDEYESAWGDGPLLPIFARVRIEDSQGNQVDAPKALGRARFLWEWRDVSNSTAPLGREATDFVKRRLAFQNGGNLALGQNCHIHFGGKRGAPARVFFPAQNGQAPSGDWSSGFPFIVEPCARRTGCVLSQSWTTGKLAGKTGVIFNPSRMAGDAYQVTVHVALEKGADGQLVLDAPAATTALPAAHTKSTCKFEVWREVHLVRYLKKKSSISDVSIKSIKENYEDAFLRLVDISGGSTPMDEADYNARIRRYLATLDPRPVNWNDRHIHSAIDPTVNQYAKSSSAFHFRSFSAFRSAFLNGLTEEQKRNWLGSQGRYIPNTQEKYEKTWCQSAANLLVREVFQDYLDDENPGITLLQFEGAHNIDVVGAHTAGTADFFSVDQARRRDRHHSMFALFGHSGIYDKMEEGSGGNAVDTVTHEIGHLLFLPHAPLPAPPSPNTPGGSRADLHDPLANCLMGYDYSNARTICGFCILRLRGWDGSRI